MSIFRACTRSSLVLKRTGFSISGQLPRYTSTEATHDAEKSDGEIVIQPPRDVLVADVISGAPGMFSKTCNYNIFT
jgi:NADH dehydrogenase (ubiquinone) Fe-S protein 4